MTAWLPGDFTLGWVHYKFDTQRKVLRQFEGVGMYLIGNCMNYRYSLLILFH